MTAGERLSRRRVLSALAGIPVLARLAGPLSASAAAKPGGQGAGGGVAGAATSGVPDFARYGITIHPRAEWGGDLAAKAAMPVEADVRALVVHHSASSNSYGAAAVPGVLRGFYRFHTAEKRWPDVAYSFFVDRFGGVWEGRTGSLRSPVAGSATGGNQGYTRLVCLIGDYSATTPPPAMVEALTGVLAALADAHGIDTAVGGSSTSFVSKGSNKWKAGATVTVPTICGHRQLSQTSCPGDAAWSLIRSGKLTASVGARRQRGR